ncbi:MAG: GNAT family N-acetyltransferase [Methylobacter sp.]
MSKKIKQLLSHPDASLFVAVEGPDVLGFVSLHFIPQIALEGDFCRISYFCVAEAARNKGIGTMLEAEITFQAQRRQCDRIEAHCHSRREAAHKFYYRQGYSESPKYLMKSLK